jgi:hypothetical protein
MMPLRFPKLAGFLVDRMNAAIISQPVGVSQLRSCHATSRRSAKSEMAISLYLFV